MESDEKPSTLELGRADALNARTQQYFEVAGILDELLPHGLKCNSRKFQNLYKTRTNKPQPVQHSKKAISSRVRMLGGLALSMHCTRTFS